MMEIRIHKIEDRRLVASVLVDNGYQVHLSKRRKIGENGKPTKSDEAILVIEDLKAKVEQ